MNKMIAFCGLNCEKCDAYVATKKNDNALREKTAKLWSELNQAEILPEHINCEGCRMNGAKTVFCESLCEIRKCAQIKALESCAACTEKAECKKLCMITENNPEAAENIKV